MSEKQSSHDGPEVEKYSNHNASDADNSGSTTKNSDEHEPNNDNSKIMDEKPDLHLVAEDVDLHRNDNQLISILEQSSPQHILPYKQKISYRQNIDFTGNQSSEFGNNMTHASITSDSAPGESLPNTFKNKTHPNAKSKALGASKLVNGSAAAVVPTTTRITEEDSSQLHHEVSQNDVSNNKAPPKNKLNSFFPPVLDVKWPTEEIRSQQSTPHRVGITGPSPFTEHDLNTGDSVIHNSNVLNMEVPKYRAARMEYENQKNSDKLAGIFGHVEPDEEPNNKEQNSISTTVSTPYPTISKHPRDFPEPMETVRETRTGVNDIIPKSPLKLYVDNYNTFTKNQLAGVLENVRSNKNTPAQQFPSEQSSLKRPGHSLSKPPVLNLNSTILNTPAAKNIKDFTKTGAYNERSYLKNADKVFSDLKKKGYPGRTDGVRITSQATNTSTPKKGFDIGAQIDNHEDPSPFTSFSTGSTGLKSDTSEIRDIQAHGVDASSDDPQNYTSYSGHSNLQTRLMIQQPLQPSEGSYTYDGESDEEEENEESLLTEIMPGYANQFIPPENASGYFSPNNARSYISPATKAHLYASQIVQNRIPIFEEQNNHFNEELEQPIERLHDIPRQHAHGSRASSNSVIWKTISQLQLNKGGTTAGNTHPKVTKGRVQPDIAIPSEINGMVFDPVKQTWNSMDAVRHTTFDSIEDLVDDSHPTTSTTIPSSRKKQKFAALPRLPQPQQPVQPHQSILKKNSSKRPTEPLEVSFHEPDYSSGSDRANPISYGDVTRVSQIHDVSFSESNKHLVSAITEILDLQNSHDEEVVSWKEIREISLDHFNLNNVKWLGTLMPSLISVDLSHNDLKYLTGVPRQIMQLDLSHNRIEGITPFSDYRDLQQLYLDNNQLTMITNLRLNVHLTDLSLENNKITSLRGLGGLTNLRTLNASENELLGRLDFNDLPLKNLQVLNLSNNNIQEIAGLHHLKLLRVLTVDNNSLMRFECESSSVAKLLVRFNNIRYLDISKMTQLRALKIDENFIELVEGLDNMALIEELSCKSQARNGILTQILDKCSKLRKLDISGNRDYFSSLPKSKEPKTFPLVSDLTLSAMNLENVPYDLHAKFPNVQNLNLSFNKLSDIRGLQQYTSLKKVYLIDNLLESYGPILVGMRGSRKSLRLLDVRMNPCTRDIYPYLFSADEKDATNLDIVRGEDIQSFLVNYKELDHSDQWAARDKRFLHDLVKLEDDVLLRKRDIFECFVGLYFTFLVKLDGNILKKSRKDYLFKLYQSLEQ
ncbi:Septation initiation network scaffold protein cdc11 [Candida viswanathii]|uniref:Septation initiation network scaffold protein cdc11 n=1 Tax=Candida viswanathii TaxID=5486 RepID=A0A367XUT1_9ASCO|nr:Septation initiation network scaffold protein cdc11 [Candida viswanathii]